MTIKFKCILFIAFVRPAWNRFTFNDNIRELSFNERELSYNIFARNQAKFGNGKKKSTLETKLLFDIENKNQT